MLDQVHAANGTIRELAAVSPRRGRLLIFPHAAPHKARPVVAEGLPKLLLRGEMH